MAERIRRREFVKRSTAALTGATLAAPRLAAAGAARATQPVRVGIIGMGGRGSGHLRMLLGMDDVRVPAVCDVDPAAVERARQVAAKAGHGKPEGYHRGAEDYLRLLARDDLDAVIITTPWNLHAPMTIATMKHGKYAASEVPIALTVDQCLELVRTHEATGVPCMMLENWSFRRDNLAVLNMIRRGLLGHIVHGHCAYSHNCIHWFFDAKGNPRWNAEFLRTRNGLQYATHGVGPMPGWMDLNCGDRIDFVTAVATRSTGINDQLTRHFGADHPAARQTYLQGDIVTAVVRTVQGKTFVVNNDIQLPRPYDNRWLIQGTRGIYSESQGVYIEGAQPGPARWRPFAPYQQKYDHALWRNLTAAELRKGHGGTDYVELRALLTAVRNRSQTPLDVYDSVTISVINPLSQQSIARGSAPVKCPDFTHGKWQTTEPKFAVDMTG